jgi:methylated-DNA-[protein]-cysteine S-methyltransferase
MPELSAGHVDTPLGRLALVASAAGLRAVLWPGAEIPAAGHRPHPALAAAGRQLDEYFAGRRRRFELSLDLAGTRFQVAAWRALEDIPYAQTRTYSEQATRLLAPRAARAVGAANARNPLPIVLPCHRLVGAGGELRGFGGGLDAKRWLLEHERRVSLA